MNSHFWVRRLTVEVLDARLFAQLGDREPLQFGIFEALGKGDVRL
jgi:hypothetical protein